MKIFFSFTLLFCCLSLNSTIAQEEISIERKINRLYKLEEAIYRLPFDRNHIRTVVIPEINEQKLVLAPNYPNVLHKFNQEKDDLIIYWIENHSDEYNAYVTYLQTYVRTNK